MTRRAKTPAQPWVVTLELPDGWVALPPRHQREPLLPSRDPYLRAAKQLVDLGSIPADLVKRTQLYLSHILPSGERSLAGAGRVRGTSPGDSVLESCWVVGPSNSAWDSVDGLTRFAVEHPLAERSIVEQPVALSATLGPAVRLRYRKEARGGRVDDVLIYWVWLTETDQALSVAGGYDGGPGEDWDRFLADLDSMVTTLRFFRGQQ